MTGDYDFIPLEITNATWNEVAHLFNELLMNYIHLYGYDYAHWKPLNPTDSLQPLRLRL